MPVTSDSRRYRDLVDERPDGIRILAEGDSWFAYPRKFILLGSDANVIDHLGGNPDLLIYNTSNNGDEASEMISGEQKFSLIKRLTYNEFDFMLFSGGGNDLVGRYDFDFVLRERSDESMGWRECINDERLTLKLKQLECTYRILCQLVEEHSTNPNIKIVTHTYDVAPPRQTGFELFDLFPLGKSWMHPYLEKYNIRNPDDQKAVVAHMLSGFRDMLRHVAVDHPILQVVDTHGTVADDQWRNEIHPTSQGFGLIADKIYADALS